jgi:hypothetical protein
MLHRKGTATARFPSIVVLWQRGHYIVRPSLCTPCETTGLTGSHNPTSLEVLVSTWLCIFPMWLFTYLLYYKQWRNEKLSPCVQIVILERLAVKIYVKSFSFQFFFLQSHYVAQAGFKFVILVFQPPESWDYNCALPTPAYVLSSNFSFYFIILFL